MYAIVTGASKGIGKAMAECLAEMGYELALVSLPGEDLEQVSYDVQHRYKVNVKFLELDLTQQDAPLYVRQWCEAEDIRFNVLINNAGIGYEGHFHHFDSSFYETLLKVNVIAPTLLTRELLPLLKKNDKAWILNCSSFAGFYIVPYKTVYASSKSYITHFSSALREELKKFNISVSCICPAGVDTFADSSRRIEQLGWIAKVGRKTAMEVAHVAIRQMFMGKRKIIPGRVNVWIYYLSRLIPQRIWTFLIGRELCKFYPLAAASQESISTPGKTR